MEERFLKTRAEREEARLVSRAAECTSTSWDRLHFESQSKDVEQSVAQRLEQRDAAGAQEHLNVFKSIVQDATSSNTLTAYDMAKTNATLSRLQGLIDNARREGSSVKRFKFSSKPKTGATAVEERSTSRRGPGERRENSEEEEVAAAAPSSAAEPVDEDRAGPKANVFGRASHATVCIPTSRAVFVRQCEDCVILVLPTSGSVFISDCTRCRVYVACHQLRLKNCTNVDVYVWCASTPIIECCAQMRFGPYSCWTGLLYSNISGRRFDSHEEWVRCVGEMNSLEHAKTSYNTVDDFQWLKKTPSPHWSVLPAEAWEKEKRLFVEENVPQRDMKTNGCGQMCSN